MSEPTPRWLLRLENYDSAVTWLGEALDLAASRGLSELEKAGTIQRFEIAWELGWKVMADYLAHALAPPDEYTPSRSIRAAFSAGLIADGDAWMAAGRLRNQLSHTYSVTARDAGLEALRTTLWPIFPALRDTMKARVEAA